MKIEIYGFTLKNCRWTCPNSNISQRPITKLISFLSCYRFQSFWMRWFHKRSSLMAAQRRTCKPADNLWVFLFLKRLAERDQWKRMSHWCYSKFRFDIFRVLPRWSTAFDHRPLIGRRTVDFEGLRTLMSRFTKSLLSFNKNPLFFVPSSAWSSFADSKR